MNDLINKVVNYYIADADNATETNAAKKAINA